MSTADEIARALAARDADVADLVRRAEEGARADVEETLRRLFAEDLLRRALGHVSEKRPAFALAGVRRGWSLVHELDEALLRDEAGLEAAVRVHNDLLVAAHARGAVIPFRIGSLFPDRAVLEEWIEHRRPGLELELERLRDSSEWVVEPMAGDLDAEPGRYLEARLATAVRPDVRGRLAAAAAEAAGDAYLVRASAQAEFDATLAQLEEEGHRLRVTGPWPAYSFARLP